MNRVTIWFLTLSKHSFVPRQLLSMNKRHPRYIPHVKELSILCEGVNHSKSLLKHHRASVSSPCTHSDIIIMWSVFHFVYNIMWNKTADDGRGVRDGGGVKGGWERECVRERVSVGGGRRTLSVCHYTPKERQRPIRSGSFFFFYTLLLLLHFRVIDSCRAIPSRMEFVLIYDVKKRVAHTLNTTAAATIAYCRLTYIR